MHWKGWLWLIEFAYDVMFEDFNKFIIRITEVGVKKKPRPRMNNRDTRVLIDV